MTEFDKEEFWRALGRLYDSTVELKESMAGLRETVAGLEKGALLVLQATTRLQYVVEQHERRLDRTEVTVEAILEDLRRHRAGGTA